MERSKIMIPIFDGEDYGIWKQRITMFLKYKECEIVTTRAKTETDSEDWDKKDLKAINIIYSTITNRQLEYIREEKTAYEIMKKFDEMYLKESTALQFVCRRRLEKIRPDNYSDSVPFFSDFEKLISELKSAGAKVSEKERWHRMLGHVNFKYLNILGKEQLVTGIPNEFEKEFFKCTVCIESKVHNLPFKNNRTEARQIMEIIHTDVCGPFKTTGFNGEKYFISFIDDYSKIARIYCIKSKDEVFDSIVQFINEAENLTGKRLKILRCDNGKEYLNNRIYKFARDKGLRINNCPTYVHELNGIAEWYNRTVMDMARCLLAEAKVHKRYWPEIVCTAAYLKNRILANTIERKTPFEIFFGRKPSVENLHLYGSKVFVRRLEQERVSKWDKKTDMGILLGYSEIGYRVLLDGEIAVARHIEVIETDTKYIVFEENSLDADSDDSKDKYN